jgi:GNAT superfamily N-acetyltransferase
MRGRPTGAEHRSTAAADNHSVDPEEYLHGYDQIRPWARQSRRHRVKQEVVLMRDSGRVTVEELAELFESSGIQRPHRDAERLARMLESSNLVIAARVADRLVGIARCLTDFSWCCYVADLAVSRDRQRSGIGRQLLAEVQAAVGDECTVLLNAGPGAESYYPHIGFERVASAWKMQRKR